MILKNKIIKYKLSSGDGVTQVMSIYEANIIENSKLDLGVAGRDLSEYMVELMKERGYSFDSDLELAREVKEKVGIVSMDFEEDINKSMSSNFFDKTFELPDGEKIVLGNESFRVSEPLFNPSIIGNQSQGIHNMLYRSIMNCPIDTRKDLYCNIVVSGGNTFYSGFSDRLQKEILKLAPTPVRTKVICPPERRYSVWIGMSILSSLSSFNNCWISKYDYDEKGPSIIHERCRN